MTDSKHRLECWGAMHTNQGWHLKREGYGYIADVNFRNAGIDEQERLMCLIAAAPNLLRQRDALLEAAEQMLAWVETYEEDMRKYSDWEEGEELEDASALRAAIAEAKRLTD